MADTTGASSTPQPFRIGFATSAQDITEIAALFTEYTDSLGIDLTYQSYAEELAGLPGKYAAPHGVLLIARSTDDAARPIGCVALRPLPLSPTPESGAVSSSSERPHRRCELKRLYVRSEARGTGLGEALARAALDEAAARGYTEVVMDTLASMAAARRLYAKLGFAETDAYYETPIAGTIFFRRKLP